MFITLRSSRGPNEGGGMEQVMRRNAGPSGIKNRVRPARRSACVACQTKRLRCTGSPRNCDRCRTRLIECVFPTSSSSQDNRRTHSPNPSSLSRPAWQEVDEASPQQGSSSRGSASGEGMSGPELPTVTIPEAPAGDGALNSDFFDYFIDGFNMGMGDLGGDSALDVRSDLSPIISEESDTHRPNKSTQDAYDAGGMSSGAPAQLDCPSSQRQLPTLANNIAQELPNRLALDTNSHSPAQSSALSGVPSPLTADRNSSPPCCCLNDLVRVVQQLDDDEFRITTMSLDQVLQLQKWLVFQCCKPFDCPQCLDLPTVDTLRLIVCDRLTEMFECIHLRIKRAGDILVGHSSDSGTQSVSSQSPDSHSAASRDSPHSVRQPPAVAAWPSPAQLFCGSSGRAANKAACNPLMFSDDFRNQYSDEEQVHMIRVLLRLQIRNFHNLLLQVERASQGATSQARQAKVKSMLMRLSKAGMDIEGALRVVFRSLSLSRDLSFSAQDQHRHLGAFDVAFSESDHDIR